MATTLRQLFTVLVLLLLLCVCSVSIAEVPLTFDYRNDTQSFCDKVAELNAEADIIALAKEPQGFQNTLVLFQTTVVPLSFEEADFEPLSIVYGPRGFSVLLCTKPEAAMTWLLKQDGVLYAEIDSEVSGCSYENADTSISFQSWGAESAGFGDYINYAKNWGSGICTIAVIDSGVYQHDLINSKIRVLGHDYIDNDNDPTNDLNGHGTRVAGIVADCTRELPVYIYPIRVLDADASGKTSNVISAVLEATDARVTIINLSLSTFSQSELLESAIRSANSAGIIVVVAAGNYACDASEVTPACMPDSGVIVVGSAEADGSRSSFSNYGASVDLYFYGRNISCCSRTGGYVSDTGTSMAAPHISAICAMMKLMHPSISAEAIVSRINSTYSEKLYVLNATAMIPRSLGFDIHDVSLRVNDTLPLPVLAKPTTSQETIQYSVTDPNVITVADGVITAKAAGSAEVFVACKGFEDSVIPVTVYDGSSCIFQLPSGLLIIENGAFQGIYTDRIVIPEGMQSIGKQAFDGGKVWYISIPASVGTIEDNNFSGAVILCQSNSPAYEYVMENQLQYIIND